MRTQRGSISVALVLLIMVGAAGLIWLFDDIDNPASITSVDEVIALAQSSEATRTILKRELTKTPTPTKHELRNLRRRVEEQLILDRAIALTGNATLEPASIVRAREEKFALAKMEAMNKQLSIEAMNKQRAAEKSRPADLGANIGLILVFALTILAVTSYVLLRTYPRWVPRRYRRRGWADGDEL